jgi:hypothetical protein
MIELFGNENKVATMMSKITPRTRESWVVFINAKLFQLPSDRQIRVEPSEMVKEFAIIAGCFFIVAIKHGALKYEDWIY